MYKPNSFSDALFATTIIFFFLAFTIASSGESKSEKQCDPVAYVYGETVCMEDIGFSEYMMGRMRKRLDETQFAAKRKKFLLTRLHQHVWAIALKNNFDKKSLEPSDREINTYNAFMKKADEERYERSVIVKEKIQNLLKNYSYKDEDKKTLEEAMAQYSGVIKRHKKMIKMKSSSALGDNGISKKTLNKIAIQFIKRWKTNKALYEKFGGRIIFQQFGIEPIDAYKALLADIRGKGELKIIDPNMKNVFTKMDEYLKMGHNYLDPGKNHFDKPFWEMERTENHVDEIMRHFENIPREEKEK